MPVQNLPARLVSAVMATVKELQAERVRRGFWIQRARKRKGLTLEFVAQAMGYQSISGVSRWESGDRAVPSDKFGSLARLLSLPPSFLVSPPLTDDERLDAAVRAAEELERQDSAPAPVRLPRVGAVRARRASYTVNMSTASTASMTVGSVTPATRPSLKAAFSVVGAARGSERRRWIARIMPRLTGGGRVV